MFHTHLVPPLPACHPPLSRSKRQPKPSVHAPSIRNFKEVLPSPFSNNKSNSASTGIAATFKNRPTGKTLHLALLTMDQFGAFFLLGKNSTFQSSSGKNIPKLQRKELPSKSYPPKDLTAWCSKARKDRVRVPTCFLSSSWWPNS